MSDHISPQAAAAREAARQASGEFGTQTHTPPEHAAGGTAAPAMLHIPGVPDPVSVDLDFWEMEWTFSDDPPEVTWEPSESGGTAVYLWWTDQDGDACRFYADRGAGEHDDEFDTLTGGVDPDSPLAKLTPDERHDLREYAHRVRSAACDLVSKTESHAANREPTRDAIVRALTHRPWTEQELARNRADQHLDTICADADNPESTSSLIRGLRDGGRLTDAQVQALEWEDVARLEAGIAAAVDLFAREQRTAR